MAFTSRAGKRNYITMSTTGPGVGPGTYSDMNTGKSGVRYSVPPFSSSVDRNAAASTQMQTPGPGHYGGETVVPRSGSSQLSSQFASRTSRMHLTKSLTPGPGSYPTQSTWGRDHTPQPASTQQERYKAINWIKIATAPSIPAPSQSFGYEEGTRGELVQGKAPTTGHAGRGTDCAGPGEYTPNYDVSKPKPSALNFGKSKTGRSIHDISKETANRPGPGSYNLAAAAAPDDNPEDRKPLTSAFASTTVRNFVDKNSKNLPGPGTYNSKSSFATRASYLVQSGGECQQAFGTTPHPKEEDSAAKAKAAAPGPGHYRVQSDFDVAKSKWSTNHGGFSGTSLRFCDPATTDKLTPGPGYYTDGTEGNTALASNLHRKVKGRYGVFGSTAQRFPTKKVNKQIGPGSYTPKRDSNPAELRRRDLRTSIFLSAVDRIPRLKEITPGVGEYNVHPRANSSGGFVPSELRFRPMKPSDSPGPGEYQSEHNTIGSRVNGVPVLVNGEVKRTTDIKRPVGDRAVRFPRTGNFVQPGPGHYECQSSLIKRTYNITIGDTWD
eukprot:TRINITY_DN5584_c0_g1_i1.p1 TRINITY_DN5584_c0_g1~~TRINITY_DN5584_c0_g1_i1.p1  ORF type:complete len:551 (+),score=89.61 TRINITY_DN5584_c0_g1_i1:37-1689(+)